MGARQRFLTLEAMRGLAALCVVILHGEGLFGAATPGSAFLAVDFFFVLSGFIMAHVYAGELDRGAPRRSFLRARLIRLYPLYLVGSLSMVVLAAASIVFRHQHTLWDYIRPLSSLPLAVWMLPNPTTVFLFPLNVPAWTLFLEIVANVAFAFGAFRRPASLLVTIGLAGLVLVVSAMTYGTVDLGWKLGTLGPGLARVFFSFPLGVLLYRMRSRIRLPAALGAAAPLVLVALLYASPSGSGRGLFDLLFVAALSPLLLLAAASHEPAGRWLQRIYIFLGVVSYPLYILHHPIMVAMAGVLDRGVPRGPVFTVACVALVAGILAVARIAAALDRQVGLAMASGRRTGQPRPGRALVDSNHRPSD